MIALPAGGQRGSKGSVVQTGDSLSHSLFDVRLGTAESFLVRWIFVACRVVGTFVLNMTLLTTVSTHASLRSFIREARTIVDGLETTFSVVLSTFNLSRE